jgi:transketolase N-terminal domain/subunit
LIDDAQLAAIAREYRVQIIRMLTHAGSGHPGRVDGHSSSH